MGKLNLKEINFKTVRELITFLDPMYGKLDGYVWVFRGQANSEWSLNSTLERSIIGKENSNKFTQEQIYWQEWIFIEEFIKSCEEIGLELPKKSDSLFNNAGKSKGLNKFLHYMALGQHYGLPTRLLDWTKDRWIALYFALDIENHLNYSRTGNLTLWCLARPNMELDIQYTIDTNKYTLKEYKPGFHGNRNAVAQKGIFTYIINHKYDIEGNWSVSRNLSEIPVEHLDLEYIAKNGYTETFGKDKDIDLLYKLNIPRKLAKEIERILSKNHISYKEIFPNYEGVCKTLTIEQKESHRRARLSSYKDMKRRKLKI